MAWTRLKVLRQCLTEESVRHAVQRTGNGNIGHEKDMQQRKLGSIKSACQFFHCFRSWISNQRPNKTLSGNEWSTDPRDVANCDFEILWSCDKGVKYWSSLSDLSIWNNPCNLHDNGQLTPESFRWPHFVDVSLTFLSFLKNRIGIRFFSTTHNTFAFRLAPSAACVTSATCRWSLAHIADNSFGWWAVDKFRLTGYTVVPLQKYNLSIAIKYKCRRIWLEVGRAYTNWSSLCIGLGLSW